MEIREFAQAIILTPSLAAKLRPPPSGISDRDPGPALRLAAPARPPDLAIVPSSAAKVPSVEGMADPRQRPRIVHALANHELQAVELFAWALLAFPGAPSDFRSGLLRLIADEQRHTLAYAERLRAWGARLGEFPVSGYFWSKVDGLASPLQFVCAMGLTFENANLDHSLTYAAAARAAGDLPTAALLEMVHVDEVEHVRFGWQWLERWKAPQESMTEAYRGNVRWPLRPALARGAIFHPGPRAAAGLDAEFIRILAEAGRDDPRETDGI